MAIYTKMAIRKYVMAVFLLLFGFSIAEEMSLNINMKKPIAVVSEKFLSITLDPVVLFTSDLLSDIEKSTNMAKALAPAYIRIAGPQSNSYVFERGLYPQATATNAGFTFTETHWESINEWAEKAGLNVISSLSTQKAEGTKSPSWDPRNALDLISFSDHMGYNISWQLGYECQTRCEVSGADLGRDVQRLRSMLDAFPRFAEHGILAGPDVVVFKTKAQQQFLQDYFNAAGAALSAITWHPEFAGISLEDDGVSMHYDNLALEKELLYKIIGRQVIKKPLWIAESKPEECKNQFLGALVWARRLGNSAKLGVQVLMRQPDDSHFFRPTPDFWVSKLHKMLVGREVLDTKIAAGNRTHVHFYCQCTKPSEKYEKGSLTIFGINLTPSKVTANLKGLKLKAIHKYILLPGYDAPNRMFSESVLLNDELLTLINGKEVPDLKPALYSAEKGVKLKLPSGGIGFWVLPGLKIKTCMGNEDEVMDKGLLKKLNKRLEDMEVEDEFAPGDDDNNSRESLDDVDSNEDKVKSTVRQQLQRRLHLRRSVRQRDVDRDDERGFRRVDGVRRDFARKRDAHFKKNVGEDSEEITSSEEPVAKKATNHKEVDSAEKIRAKINKYKKQLAEHDNRKKDREAMKTSKNRMKDTEDHSAIKVMDTGKVIEALTLITNVENSMKGLEKDNSTEKTTLPSSSFADVTSGLETKTTDNNKQGDDDLLGEILNTEKSKRTSVPTKIEDQLKALYRLLSDEKEKKDGQSPLRPRRDITKRYTDDILDSHDDSQFLYKRSKAEEAKERRMKRRQRMRERLEELKREKEEAKKETRDSIENNFYGFQYQAPMKNFPEGDLYLRTDSDYNKKVMHNDKVGKRSGKTEPKSEDWWTEEVGAHHIPTGYTANMKSPAFKPKDDLKEYGELWEAEALQKEDDNHVEQATEYPTIAIVPEKQVTESEDRKAKDQAVQQLVNYYEQVPQDQMYEYEELKKLNKLQQPSYYPSSNPTNYQQVPVKSNTQPMYATNYQHSQTAEKNPIYYPTSNSDYYANLAGFSPSGKMPYQRPKRNTEKLEALLHQEMIAQDDNNLRDCQCRVIRDAQICKDCQLQQARQLPQPPLLPPSLFTQNPPDYELNGYDPNMRFKRNVEEIEDEDEESEEESEEDEDADVEEESIAAQLPVEVRTLPGSFEIETMPEQVPITAEKVPEVIPAVTPNIPAVPVVIDNIPAVPITIENVPTVPVVIENAPAGPVVIESIPAVPVVIGNVPEEPKIIAELPIPVESPNLQPIDIIAAPIGSVTQAADVEDDLSSEEDIKESEDVKEGEVILEGSHKAVPEPINVQDDLTLKADVDDQIQSRLRRKTDNKLFLKAKPSPTPRPTKAPRTSPLSKLATPRVIPRSLGKHVANPRSAGNSTTESTSATPTSEISAAHTDQKQSTITESSSATAANTNIEPTDETTLAKANTDSKSSASNAASDTTTSEVINVQSINPIEPKDHSTDSTKSINAEQTDSTFKTNPAIVVGNSGTETVANSIADMNAEAKSANDPMIAKTSINSESDTPTTKSKIILTTIKSKQDSTTKAPNLALSKNNSTAKSDDSAKVRQARLTTRAEALAALRKENESRRAKKMIEMSMKVLDEESARFEEYQRRRREQLDRLKDKLRTKRDKMLRQYRDELIEAVNESSDLKESNLKRRDLVDEQPSADEESPANIYLAYEPIDLPTYQRPERNQEEYYEEENSDEYDLRRAKKHSMPELYDISVEEPYLVANMKRSPSVLVSQTGQAGAMEGDSSEYYTEEQRAQINQLVEEQRQALHSKKQQLAYERQLAEYYKQYGYNSQTAPSQYPTEYSQEQPNENYYDPQVVLADPEQSLSADNQQPQLPYAVQYPQVPTKSKKPRYKQLSPANPETPIITDYQQPPPSTTHYHKTPVNTQHSPAAHYQQTLPHSEQTYAAQYRETVPDTQQTYAAQYQETVPDTQQTYAAQYQETVPDTQQTYAAQYQETVPDTQQAYAAQYQETVPETQEPSSSPYQLNLPTNYHESLPSTYEQSPANNQQPSAATYQYPVPGNQQPSPTNYQQPSPVIQQQASSPVYQEPALAALDKSASALRKQLRAIVQQHASSAVYQEPIAAVPQPPAVTVYQPPLAAPGEYEQAAPTDNQEPAMAHQQPAPADQQPPTVIYHQQLPSNDPQQSLSDAYYQQTKISHKNKQQTRVARDPQAAYQQQQSTYPHYQSKFPQKAYDAQSYNEEASAAHQPQNAQYQSDQQVYKQKKSKNKQKLKINFSDTQAKNAKQLTPNPYEQPLSNVDVNFYNQLLYDKANQQQQQSNYEEQQKDAATAYNSQRPRRKFEKKPWYQDYKKSKRSSTKVVDIDPYIYDDEDSDYNMHNLYMRPSARSLIRSYRHEPADGYYNARYKRETDLEGKEDGPLFFSLGLDDNRMNEDSDSSGEHLRRKRTAENLSPFQSKSPINKNVKKAFREEYSGKYKKYPKSLSQQQSSRREKRSIDATIPYDLRDNHIDRFDDSEMKEVWSNLVDLKQDEQLLKQFDLQKSQISEDLKENQRNLDRYLQSKTTASATSTTEKTTTQTNIQSMIVDAIPKLQTVITNGLKKADDVSGNLETFIDTFDEEVNETTEKEGDEEHDDDIDNATISHGVFKNVVGGVKKVFGFVMNLTKILH